MDINSLYQQYLGRAPDAAGLDYWNSAAKTASPQDLLGGFINAAHAENPNLDQFAGYGGQQVMTGDNYTGRLQDGLNSYNKATGGNMTLQQYDQQLNPSTYGARWGVPAPATPTPQAAAQTPGTAMPDGGGYTSQNPYLGNMANEIGRRSQLSLNDALNSIRSNAVGVGGLGGTRQGVAQGVATGRAMDSLQGNLAGLFGGQYNADANRDLSRYQGDQSFFTNQRGQDLQQVGLGADLWSKGVQGPWGSLTNAGNIFDTTAGLNTTGMNTAQQGGGLPGAFGGALGSYALGQKAGLWGNTPTPTGGPVVGANWPTYGGTNQFAGWGDPSGASGAWT